MTPVAVALALTVAVVLAVAIAQATLRFIYSYALTDRHLEVRLFGRFTIYAIARDSIVGAAAWRFSRATLARTFTTLSLGNRIFGRAIAIEQRASFPRFVVVPRTTPMRSLRRSQPASAQPRLRRGSDSKRTRRPSTIAFLTRGELAERPVLVNGRPCHASR